jgi:hypothetical protein
MVGYVSIMDSLNLLPGLEDAKTVLASAAHWARDFIFVRMPSYEEEAYLRELGLKQFWYDWTRHPMHPRLDQLTAILQSLDLKQYHVSLRQPASSSEASSLLPLGAPPDQGDYDPALHGPKPSITFARPIYGQIDVFIALRPFDAGEWHDIIRRGTWS